MATLELMPFGIFLFRKQRIFLKTMEAQEITMHVREHQSPVLMSFLRQRFPRATFGYSEEKKLLFLKDPQLLRKANGEE